MYRLQPLLRSTLRPTPALHRTAVLLPRFKSTSSPKSAESASAASGGSRSKSAAESSQTPTSGVPDSLSDGEVLGRTGGGEPLEASSNPPPRPKVRNQDIPEGKDKHLSEEQKKEVDEHNKDFEAKHDRANPAEDDKVDQKFWEGGAGSKN